MLGEAAKPGEASPSLQVRPVATSASRTQGAGLVWASSLHTLSYPDLIFKGNFSCFISLGLCSISLRPTQRLKYVRTTHLMEIRKAF